MKKLLVILVLFCSCEEDDPGLQIGCQSGISKITGERQYIRCTDRESFNCANNTDCTAGPDSGLSDETWDHYTNQKWTPVSDCSECQTMDYSTVQ